METGKVKCLVAISACGTGGGVVFKVMESHHLFETDLKEYAGSVEDIFYEGVGIPEEPGTYMFEGTINRTDQDHLYYEGEFTPYSPENKTLILLTHLKNLVESSENYLYRKSYTTTHSFISTLNTCKNYLRGLK